MAEVMFRDGPRNLPEHVADLMAGLETFRMTYEQAVKEMNAGMLSSHLGRVEQKIIKSHFEQSRERR